MRALQITQCATGKPTASVYNTVFIPVRYVESVIRSNTENRSLLSLYQKSMLAPNDESQYLTRYGC